MVTLKRPDGNLPEDFHLSRRGVATAIFAGYAVAAFSAEAEPIHHRRGRAGHRDRPAGDRRRQSYPRLRRPAQGGRPLPGGDRGQRGVRPARLHPRHLPALREARLRGDRARLLRPRRRSGAAVDGAVRPDPEDRRHGHRPAGDERCRRDAEVPGGAALRRRRRHIAITGFCWGGKVVWNACETFPDLKAGVAWYGQLAPVGTAPADPAHPRLWPIEHAADLQVSGARPLRRQGPAQPGRARDARRR